MKNLTITTEHEGIKKTTLLKELENFLEEMYNVSPNVSVFITKVTYGVTDETCTLSKKDQESLETWYYSIR
tara:strand:+ start:107 stop:319 length:213 start_codon:yes stop_codon:yes gene_type:complete